MRTNAPHCRLRVAAFALTCVASLIVAAPGVASAGPPLPGSPRPAARPAVADTSDWTTFDQNGMRTGVDASGDSFQPARSAWTTPALDGTLYGQPLVATGRVFVATENDTVYALAADSGAVLWRTHVGTAFDPSTVPGLCGDILPTVGITSTPVIDSSRSELFVVAAEQVAGGAVHHLIGLDLYTGTVVLDQVIDPPGSNPPFELQRASLALADGRVVVGFGGNDGDCGSYHGLVVSGPESGGAPATYTVAAADNEGAVWMGGAAPSIDASGNVWIATGNSAHTSSTDTYDHSDSVLELSPTMQLLASFAPTAWYADNNTDSDLGSTAPALLPNGLVFQVGKSTTAYVLRQSHPGGIGGQVALTKSFCFADGGSADLDGTLFVPCSGGIEAVTPRASPPAATWSTSSGAHSSPIVAGGEVWSIGGDTLYALDRTTGAERQQFTIGSTASSFPSPSAADGLVLAPSSDQVHAFAGPGGLPGPPSAPPASCGCARSGYDLVAADGGIFAFGDGGFFGSTGSLALNRPIVGMASTPDGRGYWLVAADGGIFAFGDGGFFGSTGSLALNRPIVGMASTPDGRGYWLVAADGGIFAFGDGGFFGSTGSLALNRPIVGMASTPDGRGYWLVAADGGIFAFGDGGFFGSTGSLALNRPIVGMASTPDGRGYWLVAADGGIFAFGDGGFFGSTGSLALNRPIVGMASTPDGRGYWLVAADGGIFAFGDAGFFGSMGGSPLNQPIVGMVAGPPG